MKKVIVLFFCGIVLSGCSLALSATDFSSDQEPLLRFDDNKGRRIVCQDGRVFEGKEPGGKTSFFFLGNLDAEEVKMIKQKIGNKAISFVGDEYELPENIFPMVYPDNCILDYNGGDKEAKIDYKKCKEHRDWADNFSFIPRFESLEKDHSIIDPITHSMEWVKLGIKRNSVTNLCTQAH